MTGKHGRTRALAAAIAVVLACSVVGCRKQPDSQGPGTSQDPSTKLSQRIKPPNLSGGDPDDRAAAQIAEQVILENRGVKVTAKALTQGQIGDWTIDVLIENYSDTPVVIIVRDSAVNGIMVEMYINAEVLPGKRQNTTITLAVHEIGEDRITVVAEICFRLAVINPDTRRDVFQSDLITLQSSAAGSYQQGFDDDGTVLIDQAGIKISYTGTVLTGNYYTEVGLFVQNTSNDYLVVSGSDVTVNGLDTGASYLCKVLPGKVAYTQIYIYKRDLDENGIESIQSIDISFEVREKEGYLPLFESDIVTIVIDPG